MMKDVYTLKDLRSGLIPEKAKLAVIGNPIAHSASPQMHEAAMTALGIDIKYIRILVEKGEVADAFSLMQGLNFIGCNVTIPHKQEALEALEPCDEVSQSVRALGVANTISFRDGRIIADNTDGPGLVQALAEELEVNLKDTSTLVLGAGGGAGKAIATQLVLEQCPNLILSNRTVSKLDQLVAEVQEWSKDTNFTLIGNVREELAEVAQRVGLIINATSLGMQESDPLPFPKDSLLPQHKVYDAIYKPALTALLKSAKETGAGVANGLSMLVHQGAISFRIWHGVTPDVQVMRAAIT